MESSALDTKLPPAARAVRAIIASDPDDLSSGLSSLAASFLSSMVCNLSVLPSRL